MELKTDFTCDNYIFIYLAEIQINPQIKFFHLVIFYHRVSLNLGVIKIYLEVKKAGSIQLTFLFVLKKKKNY